MKDMDIRRSVCRLCESKNLKSVFRMADTPIGDEYLSKKNIHTQGTYPVEFFLCLDCGHAQLLDVLKPESVYSEYIYKTSDSLGLVDHFNNAANSIMSKIKPKEGDFVVDIGSNDGSFLRFFKNKGMNVTGVEPAQRIANIASESGIETVNSFFDIEVAKDIKKNKGPAKIVTSNNTFANIDDLIGFMKGVKELLKKDGVFVIETGYVLDLLEKKIFDNIYHEHISYFSIKPLKNFFELQGFELIDVERISPKGGSIRCTAQLSGGKRTPSKKINELIKLEEKIKVHEPETFKKFYDSIKILGRKTKELIQNLEHEGKKVAGYGASVGVTTVLYNFNLDKNTIPFLVDDNERRQNLFSPGLHIPVKSPREIYNQNIDYVIILAWQYSDPIINKHKEFIDKGGSFINILPNLEIISKEDLDKR